jgi:hypothetical protein
LAVFAVLIGLFVILCIDGAAYDRWNVAKELQYARGAWEADGAPAVFEISRYASVSKSHTIFLSTESFIVGGQTYVTFLGIKSQRRPNETYFITTNGMMLIQPDGGEMRLLKTHKSKAAAW